MCKQINIIGGYTGLGQEEAASMESGPDLGVEDWVPQLVQDDHVAGSHQVDSQRTGLCAEEEHLPGNEGSLQRLMRFDHQSI